MPTQTSLMEQQVRIQQWGNKSGNARAVRKEWMLEPGVIKAWQSFYFASLIMLECEHFTSSFMKEFEYLPLSRISAGISA